MLRAYDKNNKLLKENVDYIINGSTFTDLKGIVSKVEYNHVYKPNRAERRLNK
jgi:hypothetical protein